MMTPLLNRATKLTLSEKLQHLRHLEGQLRGLDRPQSKTEVVHLMRGELGESLSLPYLSQIENGTRPHLTARTRSLLARFFRVHPGYLVGDPDGFEENLTSPVDVAPLDLREWLTLRAEEQRQDPDVYEALLRLASEPDPRSALLAASRALQGTGGDESVAYVHA